MNHLDRSVFKACAIIAVACLVGVAASPARADVLYGESNAYGIDMNVNAGGSFVISQAGESDGSGGSPYTDSNAVLNAGISSPPVMTLTATAVTSNVSSNVDGTPGSRTVTGNSSVLGLNLNAFFGFATSTVDLITANATVSGDYGALSTSGASTLVNAALSINGVTVSVPANPSPNFLLYNNAGISIVLNEQILTGDDINNAGIEVNAVHVTLNNVLGVANGDIVLGHAFAYAEASNIPEPASACLILLGAPVVLLRRRRAV